MNTGAKEVHKRMHWQETGITTLDVDTIVNAANPRLRGGGGLDRIIHKAAGPELLQWCIAHCPEGTDYGKAVLSPGFNLKARYVIHAVGPDCHRFRDPEKCEALLRSAYLNSLKIAAEKQFETIAFPNISTGIYGFPKAAAARIAINAVKEFLDRNTYPRKVIFTVLDPENIKFYRELLG